jgi:hypothetical protein
MAGLACSKAQLRPALPYVLDLNAQRNVSDGSRPSLPPEEPQNTGSSVQPIVRSAERNKP